VTILSKAHPDNVQMCIVFKNGMEKKFKNR